MGAFHFLETKPGKLSDRKGCRKKKIKIKGKGREEKVWVPKHLLVLGARSAGWALRAR